MVVVEDTRRLIRAAMDTTIDLDIVLLRDRGMDLLNNSTVVLELIWHHHPLCVVILDDQVEAPHLLGL